MSKSTYLAELGQELVRIQASKQACQQRLEEATAPITVELASLNGAEHGVRERIADEMTHHGLKSAVADNVTLTMREGRRTTITDEVQLVAALKESGRYQSCVTETLNRTRAKAIGLEHEMPGVESVDFSELQVRVKDGGKS